MGRPSENPRFRRLRRLSDGPYSADTVRQGRRYLIDDPDHGPAWHLVGIKLIGLARYEEAEQARQDHRTVPEGYASRSLQFESGGLLRPSDVRPGKRFTAGGSLIVRSVGVLSSEAFERVLPAVADLFRLPNRP